jgi:hypothetical protein
MFAITVPAGAGAALAGALLWDVVVAPGFELAAGANAAGLPGVPAMNDWPAPPPDPQPTTEAIATKAAPDLINTLGFKPTQHLGNRELQLTESKVGRHLLWLYLGRGLGGWRKNLTGF